MRIAAYNNATARTNIFSQTDLTARRPTGGVRHTMLVGVTLGRQRTDNVRITGYFNDTTTSVDVPLDDPVTNAPMTFRQSDRDVDNRAVSSTASLHVQDQIALGERLRVVGGVGVERFGDGSQPSRRHQHVAHRRDGVARGGGGVQAGRRVSVYGSYSVSALPSAGDQFSSLDATSATLEPERFRNLEVGAKWDVAGTSRSASQRTSSTAASPFTRPDRPDPHRAVR